MVEEHGARVVAYEQARDLIRDNARDLVEAYPMAFGYLAHATRTSSTLDDLRAVADGLQAGLSELKAGTRA